MNRTCKIGIILALVLAGLVIIFILPAEADRRQVVFEASLTVEAGKIEHGVTEVYVPAIPDSADYAASFLVGNGGIVKFYAFDSATWQLWQEGKFNPSWTEGSEGELWMSISTGKATSEYASLYLVVVNNGSVSQNVQVRVTEAWHESSYAGLLGGSAVVSLGVGLVPLLMYGKSRMHFVYSVTIYVMSFLMVSFLASAQYVTTPPDPIYGVTQVMPPVLFLEAFPLIVLLYLLNRNKTFAHFKAWNMGAKLQVAAAFLLFGYAIPIVFMALRIVSLAMYWPINPDSLTASSLIIGGLLMLVGLMVFISLLGIHRQSRIRKMSPIVI